MRCPFCSNDGNKVIDSRLARDGSEIRRRRECDECARRFTTRERVEEVLPRVIKRDERREEYNRDKLLRGVEHACVKRPVSAEAIGQLLDRLERELQESGEREVTSDHIGRRALEELAAIDVLAGVRFASVFLDFSSPGDYEAFFSELSAGANLTDKSMETEEADGTPKAGKTMGDRAVRSLGARR